MKKFIQNKTKKKVLYLISSFRHGRGGHLTCLKVLTQNLNKKNIKPIIVVTGRGVEPSTFDKIECSKYIFFTDKGVAGFQNIIKKLENVVKREQPNIIHSFNNHSLFFAMYLNKLFKIPFIHTKPGGGNHDLPKIPYLILYSKENKDFFTNHPKFQSTKIFYLPARVSNPLPDLERIEELKKITKFTNEPIFLRITRINPVYKESIIQGIKLIKRLNKEGVISNYLILGAKEEDTLYRNLKSYENNHIKLITKERYTQNADAIIDIADFVIGVGNSFMAAAARSKILLATIKGSIYPLIVNKNNFQKIFRYNFSPRSTLSFDEEKNYQEIKKIIFSSSKQKKYKLFAKNLFNNHFNIKHEINNYEKIYREITYNNITPLKDYYFRLKYTLIAFNTKKFNYFKLFFLNIKIIFKLFIKSMS